MLPSLETLVKVENTEEDKEYSICNADSDFAKTSTASEMKKNKQFPCEQCDKVFKNKYRLKETVLCMHTIHPSDSCDKCDHKARNVCHLEKHISIIHERNI